MTKNSDLLSTTAIPEPTQKSEFKPTHTSRDYGYYNQTRKGRPAWEVPFSQLATKPDLGGGLHPEHAQYHGHGATDEMLDAAWEIDAAAPKANDAQIVYEGKMSDTSIQGPRVR